MHGWADLAPDDRQVFTQIDAIAQIVNRFLSGENLLFRCRFGKPPGQSLLACPCAGCAKQFKKGSATEDVEVGRIEVRFVPHDLGGLSPSNPSIFDARDSVLVIFYRSLRAALLLR